MAEEQARWYVIHTYSGYEAMVKDSLEKLIENNNLQERILDIQIPTEETLEEKANGKKKVVIRKKMPCYVFLKIVLNRENDELKLPNDLWYLIVNTRGVTGFVGPEGKAIPLTEDEVLKNGLERPTNVSADFIVGDTVQILTGPFQGVLGTVVSINEPAQKTMIGVETFGRTTDIEVEIFNVRKVGGDN